MSTAMETNMSFYEMKRRIAELEDQKQTLEKEFLLEKDKYTATGMDIGFIYRELELEDEIKQANQDILKLHEDKKDLNSQLKTLQLRLIQAEEECNDYKRSMDYIFCDIIQISPPKTPQMTLAKTPETSINSKGESSDKKHSGTSSNCGTDSMTSSGIARNLDRQSDFSSPATTTVRVSSSNFSSLVNATVSITSLEKSSRRVTIDDNIESSAVDGVATSTTSSRHNSRSNSPATILRSSPLVVQRPVQVSLDKGAIFTPPSKSLSRENSGANFSSSTPLMRASSLNNSRNSSPSPMSRTWSGATIDKLTGASLINRETSPELVDFTETERVAYLQNKIERTKEEREKAIRIIIKIIGKDALFSEVVSPKPKTKLQQSPSAESIIWSGKKSGRKTPSFANASNSSSIRNSYVNSPTSSSGKQTPTSTAAEHISVNLNPQELLDKLEIFASKHSGGYGSMNYGTVRYLNKAKESPRSSDKVKQFPKI